MGKSKREKNFPLWTGDKNRGDVVILSCELPDSELCRYMRIVYKGKPHMEMTKEELSECLEYVCALWGGLEK